MEEKKENIVQDDEEVGKYMIYRRWLGANNAFQIEEQGNVCYSKSQALEELKRVAENFCINEMGAAHFVKGQLDAKPAKPVTNGMILRWMGKEAISLKATPSGFLSIYPTTWEAEMCSFGILRIPCSEHKPPHAADSMTGVPRDRFGNVLPQEQMSLHDNLMKELVLWNKVRLNDNTAEGTDL